MNQYQKQIARLVDEYKCLAKHQLLRMVNKELGTHISNLDGYIAQMCRFADYTEIPYPGGTILTEKGCEPDFDMIRSVEVGLCFLDKTVSHERGQKPVYLRLFTIQGQNMKEICIIPVRAGDECVLSDFSSGKYSGNRNEILIFLLENREQIKRINTNNRLAVIENNSVVFFKK